MDAKNKAIARAAANVRRLQMTPFERWWDEIGSAIGPKPGEDIEEHTGRVARMAWAAANAHADRPAKAGERGES
jgi:hypothetical protein